ADNSGTKSGTTKKDNQETKKPDTQPGPDRPSDPGGKDPSKPGGKAPIKKGPEKPIEPVPGAKLARLYQPGVTLTSAQIAELKKTFEGQAAVVRGGPPPRVVRVGRTLPEEPGNYRSLEAAWGAIDGDTAIEIHDNGPLLVPPLALGKAANLSLRAAPGFRPLVAWDLASAPRPTWFELADGRLTLQDLDLVAKWPDTPTIGPACLFQINGGEVRAQNCSFSTSGKGPKSITAIRLQDKIGSKCRLQRCFCRGGNLTAVESHSLRAEVVVEDSLLLSGTAPALKVACTDRLPTQGRVLRSTVVAGQHFLHLEPLEAGGQPGLNWFTLDSFLARYDAGPAGTLISRPAGASQSLPSWRSVNCLVAGW